jgi:hypothetical protein
VASHSHLISLEGLKLSCISRLGPGDIYVQYQYSYGDYLVNEGKLQNTLVNYVFIILEQQPATKVKQ